MRQFIKGTDGFSGAFAECLCGSPNLYQVKDNFYYTGVSAYISNLYGVLLVVFSVKLHSFVVYLIDI